MQPIEITPYTLIWIGMGIGFLLGLIPLILGIVKKKTKLGIIGLVGSVIGGAISGIFLIVPVVAVFIYLILKKSPTASPVEDVDENSIGVRTDGSDNR